MADGDQDLSSSRITQNSVLYTTLDELNSIDIINIEQHIDTLWKKLRTAFSENTDTSITGTTNFIVWALNNVKRALLCRILEGEHADVIRSYSLDIQGRLSAMAKRWDASPGLFYALFGSQIVGSRAGIEIFNDLLKVQPELLLTDIVNRYIDVPRNDSKRLARRKQRAAVPHTPSEGAPSTNYGDEDRESISDSNEHQDEPDSGDKHTPDARQAPTADPPSINAKTSGDDAAADARSSTKTPAKQGTKPRRSRFLGTDSLISHLQENRKRARDEVLFSPEQPRREAQAFPESPQCSELLVTQETNELFYDAGTASQNSGEEDESDLEPFESGFWPGPFGSRESQRLRSASEELNAEPKFKRRRYSSIGVFQGTNLSPLQEPDVTDAIANWTPPKLDLPVRHEPVTPVQQRPAALKTVRSDSFADQSADVAPAQSKSPASREHINQCEQSIETKRESTASAKAACTSITPPGMRSMSGPKYRTMLEEISASAHRLAPGSMLNDSIINTLLHRLSSANTLVVNTLFLESRNVSDRVFEQMTKTQSTEILLPVCRNRHWVLYVFFRQENKVRLFDSLPGIMPVDEIANTVILPFLRRMGVSGEIKIDLDASQVGTLYGIYGCAWLTNTPPVSPSTE
ncbi:ulp1 protease family protein [Colletotrichum tofieldiae]|nr:ulp1 protease family protein [Colletotrichum tofieldiae]